MIMATDPSSWKHDEGSPYDRIYKMSLYLMQLKMTLQPKTPIIITTATAAAVANMVVVHQKVVVIDADVLRLWDY